MQIPVAPTASHVELLTRMVEFYSPSGSEQEIAKFLCDYLVDAGIDASIDDAGNVIGQIGDPSCRGGVVLLGHMDTVDGDIQPRKEGDLLWGRGVVDAKGALAVFIEAMRAVKDRATNPITLVGVVEEETIGSMGARTVVDHLKPEFAVIGEPSGWGSVTIGYKGRISLKYRLERESQHGAAERESALEQAVDFCVALKRFRDAFNEEKSAFQKLDLSFENIAMTPGAYDTRIDLEVHCRLPVGFETDALRNVALAAAGEAEVQFEDDALSILVDRNNRLVRAFVKAIRAAGGKPTMKVKTGTSDMNIVGPAWGVPILAYGPGDSSLDHTPREHLSLSEYETSIGIVTAVLQALACG